MGIVWYGNMIVGVDVRGAVGTKCYRVCDGRQQMMDRYEPTNRQTAEQQTWRMIVAHFAALWNDFSDEVKQEWWDKAMAARKKPRWCNGYVYYLSIELKKYRTRRTFKVGTSKVGNDYVLYGRALTVGLSLVASGDKIP